MKQILISAVITFALAMPTTLFASESVESEESTDFYTASSSSSSENAEFTEDDADDNQFATEEEVAEEDARRKEESSSRIRDWASSVNIGLRAGAGTVTFTGEDGTDWNYGFIIGASAVLNVSLTEMFMIAPELGFSYRSLSEEDEEAGFKTTVDLSAMMIEIPILVYCTFDNGLFIALGPQMNFIINSSDTETLDFGDNASNESKNTITPSTVEAGVIAGIGWKFDRDMAVDIRFSRSFTDFADKANSGTAPSFSSMYLQAGFTYMFR